MTIMVAVSIPTGLLIVLAAIFLGSLGGEGSRSPSRATPSEAGPVVKALILFFGLILLVFCLFIWVQYFSPQTLDSLDETNVSGFFRSTGQIVVTGFKWIALVFVIYFPFALIGGFLAKSNGHDFSEGYWWGQLAGPVGVIVVVFKENKTKKHQGLKQVSRSQELPRTIPFICPNCGKKYRLSMYLSGTQFKCSRCRKSVTVEASRGTLEKGDAYYEL